MTALPRRTVLTLIALLVAVTVSACGASHAAKPRSAATESSTTTSLASVQPPPTTTARVARKTARHSTRRTHHASQLHATVYVANATTRPAAHHLVAALRVSSSQNPCALVTRAEADAALHGELLREVEAPLGPTCIFERAGHTPSPTLTVETVRLHRIVKQMKSRPIRLRIQGHQAYCGTLGTSLLFVALGGGRALELSAPCAAGEALAADALPRIRS